ncbi:MAG: 50S ribosomal protein L4 [Thermodesulfobacteriota bacterium]|nr:50S ribosomal protein L4 [Thermodesulfobacteriota bacterium]
MTVVDVYDLKREKVSEVELKEVIFDVPIKNHILHQVVISQMSGRRSGTAAAKGRSDVKGSKTKLYRQKGTGRSRAGSASSPTRRGGGVAFGPIPRKYVQKVPKKVKRAALRMALTDKVHTDQLIVIDDFSLPDTKTRNFVRVMKNFEVKKALIVTRDKSVNLEKSSQNVPFVKVMRHQGLNVYDILKHDHLFMEKSVITEIEEALVS